MHAHGRKKKDQETEKEKKKKLKERKVILHWVFFSIVHKSSSLKFPRDQNPVDVESAA